jgi:WD40 repeat protein
MPLKKQFEIAQHSMAVYALSPFSEGHFISGGADKIVAIWDLQLGNQQAFSVKTERSVYSLAYKKNACLSIGLSNGDLHWIDVSLKKEIKFFKTQTEGIFSQLMLRNQSLLVTGDAEGFLRIWDLEEQKAVLQIPLECGKIRGLAQSPNNEYLAVASQDGFVHLLDTQFFNVQQKFYAHQDGANSVHYWPNDNNVLISGGKDGYLRVWDLGAVKKIKAVPAHNYAIYSIVFLADGKHFVTASRDKSIKVWALSDFKVVQKLSAKNGGHKHSVNQLICIEDKVISCSDDRRIICWKWEA